MLNLDGMTYMFEAGGKFYLWCSIENRCLCNHLSNKPG